MNFFEFFAKGFQEIPILQTQSKIITTKHSGGLGMSKVQVAVTARKILKNGKVSEHARNFESIAEAAKSVTKGKDVNLATARANICNASLGREKRKDAENRKTAYGYVWERQ